MKTESVLSGGCLCGAIRYSVRGDAMPTSLCHCVDCRKASGAPFVAWTFFRSGSLTWTRGAPKVVHFANRERSFCGDCGTPLKFYDPSIPEWYEMNTCTFDHPEALSLSDECWTEDRLPWGLSAGGIPSFHREAPLPDSL